MIFLFIGKIAAEKSRKNVSQQMCLTSVQCYHIHMNYNFIWYFFFKFQFNV